VGSEVCVCVWELRSPPDPNGDRKLTCHFLESLDFHKKSTLRGGFVITPPVLVWLYFRCHDSYTCGMVVLIVMGREKGGRKSLKVLFQR